MAHNMPAAEVDVDERLVRSLLREQHPDLAERPLRLLASGWDNVGFRLGDDLLVRLPRREAAAHLIEHEQRWLPELAPRLPLPIPAPVRTGVPAAGYPWRWSIVPFLRGAPVPLVDDLDVEEAAATLGRFLAALHVEAPDDAPRNPYRGIPLAERDPMLHEHLARAGPVVDAGRVLSVWAELVATPPWDGPPLWLHGDLHPANVLSADRRITAVIDFGDLTGGDPATDLLVAWMLLPDAARQVLRAEVGVDDDTWRRGQGWALCHGLACLAHSADNPTMHRIGLTGVSAVLAGFSG